MDPNPSLAVKIKCTDYLDLFAALPDESMHLVVTDGTVQAALRRTRKEIP